MKGDKDSRAKQKYKKTKKQKTDHLTARLSWSKELRISPATNHHHRQLLEIYRQRDRENNWPPNDRS